jgi:hypothetical protein
VQDCADCQQLIDEWKGANDTLRRMRRSALVFDYSGQTTVVDEKRRHYLDHQRRAHPLDPHDELGPPWQDARNGTRLESLRHAAPKVGIAAGVAVLIALVFLLHGS